MDLAWFSYGFVQILWGVIGFITEFLEGLCSGMNMGFDREFSTFSTGLIYRLFFWQVW